MNNTTFTVERVISGSGFKYESEQVVTKVTLSDAILAYLKAFHTGHPTWILGDTTGDRLTNEEIEQGLANLLNEVTA